MTSPPENHQPKRESGPSTNTNNPPSTAYGSPPDAPTQPPVMGYPPLYSGYPSESYVNQYPYAQPPPAPYYGSQQYPPGYEASNRCHGLIRGILAGLILLVVFLCLSALITWLVLRPDIPDFHVTTFSVSDLNVSSPAFAAKWRVNITVDNPNTKLKVYVDRIQGFMFYGSKGDTDDNLLSTSLMGPFFLDIKGKATTQADMSTGNPDQPVVASSVVDNMGKERRSGTMTFSFRMMVWSVFKSGGWWTRQLSMKVYCDELKVGFDGSANNGAIAPAKPIDCVVYV